MWYLVVGVIDVSATGLQGLKWASEFAKFSCVVAYADTSSVRSVYSAALEKLSSWLATTAYPNDMRRTEIIQDEIVSVLFDICNSLKK